MSKTECAYVDVDLIFEAAEAWVKAARKERAAEIDASACGTDLDYQRFHAAEKAAGEAQAAFREVLEKQTGQRLLY